VPGAAEQRLDLDDEPRAGTPWRGAAFGLQISGSFPAAGFSGGPVETAPGRVAVELTDDAGIEEHWALASPRWAGSTITDDGTEAIVIDHDDEMGYHLRGAGFGRYLVSAAGTMALCAPGEEPPWRWQRFMIGQVLPLAALLQGLELFHAAGLVVDDHHIAIAGPSGSGKSTTAMQLLLRGAEFLADDVVALESTDGGLIAHPGTRLASIPFPRPGTPPMEGADEIGRQVGRTEKELLVRPDGQAGPGRLRAVYVLARGSGDHALRVEPVNDVRLILACAYDWMQNDRSRHLRFLEVCSRLSVEGAAYRVGIPASAPPVAVARAIEDHASTLQ
jgi:hypothetical protein